jgi:multidrug resistance efflux pump
MEVEPGARVQAGAPIAIVHSPQVNEILSTLMRAMTDLTGREAELHVKARIARDSIEAARSGLRVSEDALRRLEAAKDQSSTSLVYRTEVYREQAQAVQNVVALEAEAAESSAQLTRLADQRQKLQGQIDQIERHFDSGRVRSPATGIVSARLSRPGETVVAGSSVAEIYEASDMSVLWYIPNFRLVDPTIGQHAFVVLGKTRLRGTIEEILPISSAFAGRKNSILQGSEATQVARIRLDPGTRPPALDSVVHVHMYYTEAADRFFRAAVRFLRLD